MGRPFRCGVGGQHTWLSPKRRSLVFLHEFHEFAWDRLGFESRHRNALPRSDPGSLFFASLTTFRTFFPRQIDAHVRNKTPLIFSLFFPIYFCYFCAAAVFCGFCASRRDAGFHRHAASQPPRSEGGLVRLVRAHVRVRAHAVLRVITFVCGPFAQTTTGRGIAGSHGHSKAARRAPADRGVLALRVVRREPRVMHHVRRDVSATVLLTELGAGSRVKIFMRPGQRARQQTELW